MHIITDENADEFYDACRDVTMMLVELAEGRGRLSDANIWVRFDPLKFVDATDDGRFHYGNIDHVRAGSALSILCDFYDQGDEEAALLNEYTAPYLQAIRDGRLSKFPDIISIINEALIREADGSLWPWFNQVTAPIYEGYVRSYFFSACKCSTLDGPKVNIYLPPYCRLN